MKRSIQSLQRQVIQLFGKIVAGSTSLSIDAAEVTNATDSFESTAHGLVTGDRILVTEVGTMPSGLSEIQYWIIKVDTDNFKLATTYANAIAGTVQALADDGTAANTYALVEEIAGLDKHQISIKASAVGTYNLTLPSEYALHDIICIANAVAVDQACTVSVSGQVVTIKVNAIDETAALADGFFHFVIVGSSVSDRV